ncbi:hypothetical protein Leryth_015846 [Lithospermum erythrorhizon]|nr:hypothetical protein Leryth_015846 [Lithospermum erythrorhizon]
MIKPYKDDLFYVMQDDQLFPMLTEADGLQLSISRAEKNEESEEFSIRLGLPGFVTLSVKYNEVIIIPLQSTAYTYIGDEEERRASERTKEVTSDPILPTSAYSVVEKVKDIAQSGSIVLMTIHQPSFRIQMLLDRITVLGRGRLIYMGSPTAVSAHLAGFARPVPDGENSLEYLLDILFKGIKNKPDPVARTPVRKVPKTPRTPRSTQTKTPWSINMNLESLQSFYGGNMNSRADSGKFDYEDDDDDDNDFDNSLERKTVNTPMHMASGVYNQRLASHFYRDFSVWVYNGVKGTPRRPPSWTPARTLQHLKKFVSSLYPTPQQTPELPIALTVIHMFQLIKDLK